MLIKRYSIHSKNVQSKRQVWVCTSCFRKSWKKCLFFHQTKVQIKGWEAKGQSWRPFKIKKSAHFLEFFCQIVVVVFPLFIHVMELAWISTYFVIERMKFVQRYQYKSIETTTVSSNFTIHKLYFFFFSWNHQPRKNF